MKDDSARVLGRLEREIAYMIERESRADAEDVSQYVPPFLARPSGSYSVTAKCRE